MISLVLRLLKCDAARAVAALIMIPVLMIGGTAVAFSINPESSTIGPFHLRSYWLLYDTRRVLLWAMPLAVIGLWFLTCLFVVRAKGRSYTWSALGVLGPFGLIALTMLGSKRVGGGTPSDAWISHRHWALRVLYQVVLFVVIIIAADQLIMLKRPLVIWWQSYTTGFPAEEIIEQQNASSGMWAFGELLETVFLIVLFYLLWPICFNVAGRLPRLWAGKRGVDASR